MGYSVFANQPTEHSPRVIPAAWWRVCWICLLCAGIAAAVYFLVVPVTILVTAVLFTYLLQPVVEWMVRVSRAKNPHAARVTAVLLLYGVLIAMLVVSGTVLTNTISAQINDLKSTWSGAKQHMPHQIRSVQQWYVETIPAKTRHELKLRLQQEVRHSDKYVPKVAGMLRGIVDKVLNWIGLVIELIFVPLITFYFLTDAGKLREQLLFFIPQRQRAPVLHYAQGVDCILRHYVQGQVLLCGIAWAVVTIGLLILGIPGAILLGVVAGISRGIPVIGPVVGGIPVLGAVLFSNLGMAAFWWVLIAFTALHLFESKFLMPRILGDKLGVHPVLVIVSLLAGYEMMGLIGMFLAPPAVAIIRFVLASRRNDASEQPALCTPAKNPAAESVTTG